MPIIPFMIHRLVVLFVKLIEVEEKLMIRLMSGQAMSHLVVTWVCWLSTKIIDA